MPTDDRFPPLLSDRSPSYARAREERAHPAPVGPAQRVALLVTLFEAEDNARRLYERTGPIVEGTSLAARVNDQREIHERRGKRLTVLLSERGGSPPSTETCRPLLADADADLSREGAGPGLDSLLRSADAELDLIYSQALADPSVDDSLREAIGAVRRE